MATNGKKSMDGCLKWAGIGIILFIAFIWWISSLPSGDLSTTTESTTSTLSSRDLHPDFHSTSSQLIITNKDQFNYTNPIIELNGDYSYKTGIIINAGETYKIGLMQFANSDGQRFNPYQMKIKKITLSCSEGFAYLESVH